MKTYKEFVSENSVNDYFKRRQRERDVDAGKPVKPEPKNPQNDYFARRKKEKKLREEAVMEGRSVGTIPASVTAQLKKDAKRRERNVFHQIGTKLRDNVAKINAAALKKEEFELEEEHKVGDLVSYFHDRLGDHLYGKVASVEPDHITMKTGGQTWKVPKHLVLKADKNKVPKYRYEEFEKK
jgi:hypothetical protein